MPDSALVTAPQLADAQAKAIAIANSDRANALVVSFKTKRSSK